MTRSDLVAAILSWVHRASVRPPVSGIDVIGAWISLGEGDVNLDLRARCMVTRATQPVDGQYVMLPCDYIEALDIRVAAPPAPSPVPSYVGRELIYQPRREMGDAVTWNGAGVYAMDPPGGYCDAGGPRWFTVVGNQLEIWPIALPPDPATASAAQDPATASAAQWQPYYIEMSYFSRQALGPNDTDTTPVLSLYPNTYLYAALQHATPFLRDSDRMQVFSQGYQAAIYRANLEHERACSQGSRLVQRYRRPL
jgi:hypothetical protein